MRFATDFAVVLFSSFVTAPFLVFSRNLVPLSSRLVQRLGQDRYRRQPREFPRCPNGLIIDRKLMLEPGLRIFVFDQCLVQFVPAIAGCRSASRSESVHLRCGRSLKALAIFRFW
jgi:hypothetical protein